jgi:2-methylcitrate dehydratase
MKAFPTEALTHSPMSAVIKIMGEDNISKNEIEAVTISTVARAADILSDPSKYDPRTRETADHSLPYCISAAIADGTVTPASFTEEKILDPEIRSFLPRIKVVADPGFEKTFPELKQARAEIKTRDGNVHTRVVDYPLGDYREPMDDHTLMAKFDSMVLPVIGQERRDQLVDGINTVEHEKDISSFMALMKR